MDNSLMATMLRVWLWLMPLGMFVAAIVFGVIAALDDRWGLVGVMFVLAFVAVGLGVLNFWALYRFGEAGATVIATLATFWRERDWSPAFWSFFARFYSLPWFAWTWTKRSRDGQLTPLWSRVLLVVMSYARIAFLVVWVLFLVAVVGNMPWFTLAFALGAVLSCANMVLRAQVVYQRYGGTEVAL